MTRPPAPLIALLCCLAPPLSGCLAPMNQSRMATANEAEIIDGITHAGITRPGTWGSTAEYRSALVRAGTRRFRPDWPPETVHMLAQGFVRQGMTTQMVLYAWGRPRHTYRSRDMQGTSERWEWESHHRAKSATFVDGVLVWASAYSWN